MAYQIRVEQQVRDFIESIGMEHRREVKRALAQLQTERGDIQTLGDDLEGFSRLRAGPYRILFRYCPGKKIECVYLNRRALVYEVFEREIIEKLRGDA